MAKIDLSQLAAPSVIESLSFDTILAEMIADLQTRDPAFSALVESDPSYKIIEVCAYRELLLRQRVNEACKGVMLAYAIGADLDQIGANWGLSRNVITPANPNAFPPTPAVMEGDAAFRARIQLAPESLSVAGPEGAYVFWAKSIADVLDVSVTSPTPGDVVLSVLSRAGTGIPAQTTLDAVTAKLEDVRPLTDQVTVQAATLVNYAIEATVYTFDGPDPAAVIADCEVCAAAYAAKQKRLGLDITLSGIYAALHRPGVQRVELTAPAATIIVSESEAGNCTGIILTDGGIAQ